MLLAIAWKNIWRNKTRSLVVILAIVLGTVAGVFVAALMNGWVNQRIYDVVYTQQGHLKIQNPKFLVNEELQYALPEWDNIQSVLDTMESVQAYSARSKVVAMASTARGNSGMILKGIDLDKEKVVSNLSSYLIEGSGAYFDKELRIPSVFISNKTAEQLRIKNYRINSDDVEAMKNHLIPEASILKLDSIVGQRFLTKKLFQKAVLEYWTKAEMDAYGSVLIEYAGYYQKRARITFSFTKASGAIGYLTCQVCGVFKTSNTMFDASSAFVQNDVLQAAAGISDYQYHEVSILLKDEESMEKTQAALQEAFPELSVLNWKKLAPDVGMTADFLQVYYYIIMGIIFFALAFGIINTMLMVVLERIKELGMLMAIGMKKIKVFAMVMLETVLLTLTGSVIGMLCGALLIAITNKTGLHFASVQEGFESMGWSAVVYPSIGASFFVGVTILVIVVGVLASLIPARKALKLKPIEALRIE